MVKNNVLAAVQTILLAALVPGPVYAEPYIGFGPAWSFGTVAAPDISPSHPVNDVRTRERKHDVGLSLSAGYRWRSGWYAEAGIAELGALTHSTFHSGEDANFTFRTTAEREENVRAAEIKLGRWLGLTTNLALYAEVGAHRYANKVTTTAHVAQTEKPFGPTTVTSSSSAITDRDAAAMVGAGLAITRPDQERIKIGVSHYGGIHRTSFSVVVQFGF